MKKSDFAKFIMYTNVLCLCVLNQFSFLLEPSILCI